MGDAAVAAPEGVMALHYNPAGLGLVKRSEIEGMYQRYSLDVGQGTLGFARPLGERWGWGVSANYIDYGATNRTTVTTVGGQTVGANAGTFHGHDLAVGLSLGQHVTDFSWGVTAKGISSRYDNASATAWAVDLGALYRFPSMPLTIGATVQNLGTKLKYDRTREQLPLLGRAGLSFLTCDNRLRFSAEVEKARHETARFLCGSEFRVARMLFLRAGYDGRKDLSGGLTAGAGFRYQDFGIDYAYIPFGNVGSNHRMAVNYQWGAERGGKTERD